MNWLVNLWHLWKRSAQYLLPGFLFLPGVRFKWSNGFKLDSLETLSSFDTPVDFAKEIGRKPLDVTLGPAFFLTRSINVPLKAKSDADGILKLNLQSALPLALSTVEWRNCLSSRSTDVLNYQQYIVKRNQVTEVEGLLKALGASLRTLSLDVPYAISPIIDNRRKIDRAKQRWVWVFALLCAAALGISGLREYHVIAELQSQNQHIQTLVSSTTERLVKLTDAQKTTKTEADALKAAQLLLMSNRGRSVQILEVSKSIPLDSWVSEFELNGSTLHLGGFLKSGVNTVLTNLQNQPSIKSATLLGALSSTVRDKSRRFQFEVTFSGDPL